MYLYCLFLSSDYSKFFDYLTSKVEHILSLFSFAEISIFGDFSVQLWLSSSFIECSDVVKLVQHHVEQESSGGEDTTILSNQVRRLLEYMTEHSAVQSARQVLDLLLSHKGLGFMLVWPRLHIYTYAIFL
ncbi:hypothetical protein E2C01_030335 [Portunus trituberculatus]|uniref:Uncharacterized protein n=1 Tax=Portunus trituberculatus TaxID=210409 RepID=A0A5B7EUK8_PORTR|nr:hypothetical protein [Portunus trituberculatus]